MSHSLREWILNNRVLLVLNYSVHKHLITSCSSITHNGAVKSNTFALFDICFSICKFSQSLCIE